MSLLGTALGRAAAGLGNAASDLGNKYVDQQLALQRAQVIADIQRTSNVQQTKDIDTYTNSPQRRDTMRTEAGKDTAAAGEASVAAELAKLRNPDLTNLEAKAAGTKQKAISQNQRATLSPGQQDFIGSDKIAENSRQTAQEAQKDLYATGLKGAGSKFDKMSETGKLQLKGIEDRARELEKTIDKGLADGSLSEQPKTADGKDNPAFTNLQSVRRRYQEIGIQRQRVLAGEGVIDGAEDAANLLSESKDPGMLVKAIKQARMIGGQYGADYAQAILTNDKVPREVAAMVQDAAAAGGPGEFAFRLGGNKGAVGGEEFTKGALSKMAQEEAAKAKPGASAGAAPPLTGPAVTSDQSLAGRARAQQAGEVQAQQSAETQKQQAQAAFSALNGDRRAAYQLQSSPLFNLLTDPQKQAVFSLVNRGQ